MKLSILIFSMLISSIAMADEYDIYSDTYSHDSESEHIHQLEMQVQQLRNEESQHQFEQDMQTEINLMNGQNTVPGYPAYPR